MPQASQVTYAEIAMSRVIITITRSRSLRGHYQWSYQAGSTRYSGDVAGACPSAAAAEAMDIAVRVAGGKGYHIFAEQAVLDLIPIDMRSSI